jgi:F-type H+-transporting ATPase subunit delta
VIAEVCRIAAGPQKNFLDLLAEQRRLPVLGDIAAQFEYLRAEAEKTIDVEVRAATPLDASQEQRLAASLEKRLGRSVRLHVSLDESLLGGAVVKAGDLIIDGSVRSRLEQLAQSIMA